MERSEIIAALGPTNTGKTYRAIQTMLDHATGMIGLPLRLLAREVYDKVCAHVGTDHVALITGEEKRVPPRPFYWVCTVEAMPLDRDVDFLAVDEIQLAAHFERGHIFTDRLLNARGRKATWFMGSDAMRPLIESLVPTAQFRRFPRLSALSAEASFGLGTLPRRSAVVAFSAGKVYQVAEKLRARKGGAAVVLGALSPRARNAQVELYQSGEVEFLVATDAIGMGLNLDIDRVSFAETRKFDGHELRDLDVAELAQIAGRAGRYHRDGSFSSYDRPPLPLSVQRAIEQHRFPALSHLVWRNPVLDFTSKEGLLHSLTLPSPNPVLRLVQHAEDTETFRNVLRQPRIDERLNSIEDLRLLWSICQIPDYRRLLIDEHLHLVRDLFVEIHQQGTIRPAFLEPRLKPLCRHSGDIDAIMDRIKAVRTWTYVAHQGSWIDPGVQLSLRTSEMEDQLSDDLHLALVDRFVEKKKRSLSAANPISSAVPGRSGDFRAQLLSLKTRLEGQEGKGSEPDVGEATLDQLRLSHDGRIFLEGRVVAQLRPGNTLLHPHLHPLVEITTQQRRHLEALVAQIAHASLGPFLGTMAEPPEAAERALLYQLRANLGATYAADIQTLLPQLQATRAKTWHSQGLRVGRFAVYMRPLLKPEQIARRLAFVRAHYSGPAALGSRKHENPMESFEHFDQIGRPSLPSGRLPAQIWLQLGYAVLVGRAIRLDILEKVLERAATSDPKQLPHLVATSGGLRRREARAVAREITRRKLAS